MAGTSCEDESVDVEGIDRSSIAPDVSRLVQELVHMSVTECTSTRDLFTLQLQGSSHSLASGPPLRASWMASQRYLTFLTDWW